MKSDKAALDLPDTLAPQLATLVSGIPSAGEWLYEIKFDGYRLMARIEGKARLLTRRGHDWSAKMPDLVQELESLKLSGSWLDGEIVVLDGHGNPNFNALQNAFDRRTGAAVVYFVFDAPFLHGRDQRKDPVRVRRGALEKAIGMGSEHVRFSSAFEGDPAPVFASACERGLEGLIGKRADSHYVSARSPAWIKLKCKKRQEFVICGFTDRSDDKAQVGSLLLGVYDQGNLIPTGSVGTGWTGKEASALRKKLAALQRDTHPFGIEPGKPGRWSRRSADSEHWVAPELVGEVEFAEWTKDGQVRHAAFVGLRSDKDATSVTRE